MVLARSAMTPDIMPLVGPSLRRQVMWTIIHNLTLMRNLGPNYPFAMTKSSTEQDFSEENGVHQEK